MDTSITTPTLPANAIPADAIPAAAIPAPTTHTIVRDALCKAIVELEHAVELLEADDPATLREFLVIHVTNGEGRLFTDTILNVYAEWLVVEKRHGLSRHLAAKRLPKLMATLFGVAESHSLRRDDGKAARGYHGVIPVPDATPE